MVSVVHAAGLSGIDGYIVTVECFLSSGLPRIDIVGLPDKAVSEAAERVRAAVKQTGFDWPVSRMTVNLAPADTRKEGPLYDLPILLAILSVSGQINPVPAHTLFLGELSLTGELRPIDGVLSMALAAQKAGFTELFVPQANAGEAAYAKGVTVYPVGTVEALLSHLEGRAPLSPCPPPTMQAEDAETPDFCDVMGQESVKRALEIAAAGGHNILLCGSPGSGKSMMAKRLPSILPPLSDDEKLEMIRIYSAVGQGAEAARRSGRPFRSPHHSASSVSLVGGSGANRLPKPGEISLASRGVLFLDELPEFHTDALEALRQPLEDGVVTVSRVAGRVTFPAHFQLVAAMNPCKCGWYGTPRCTCKPSDVQRYLKRLSGPLMDRIDLQVSVPPVKFDELSARTQSHEETSAQIRARILAARRVQQTRLPEAVCCNAAIPPARIGEICRLDDAAQRILGAAFVRLGLTARAHDRILRVARTIADLDNADVISPAHLSEALQYRSLDRAQAQM